MIYGWCGMLGIAPSEVDRISLWEFGAIRDSWLIANGGRPAGDMDIDEDRLADMDIVGFEDY